MWILPPPAQCAVQLSCAIFRPPSSSLPACSAHTWHNGQFAQEMISVRLMGENHPYVIPENRRRSLWSSLWASATALRINFYKLSSYHPKFIYCGNAYAWICYETFTGSNWAGNGWHYPSKVEKMIHVTHTGCQYPTKIEIIIRMITCCEVFHTVYWEEFIGSRKMQYVGCCLGLSHLVSLSNWRYAGAFFQFLAGAC